MKNRPKPAPDRIGVNVRIPAHVHRSAKIALASLRLTWDEAATEALEAWARTRLPEK
jgi:hypothetical protein